MTMEPETATLLVQFTEMCRDDLVNDGTPCGLPSALNSSNKPPSTVHFPCRL